nr:RNA-directed DNA polymerase, eukaryota [Tanacetum cinerariifolium]
GFDNLVRESWSKHVHAEKNSIDRLKKKFQNLKANIKTWRKEGNRSIYDTKSSIQNELSSIDKIINQGMCQKETLVERNKLQHRLYDLNSLISQDMAQKEKIRWAIEGDDNSNFFHGMINKKRSQLAIRGVLVDGEWIFETAKVRNEFLSHFSSWFSAPPCQRLTLDSQFDKVLSQEQKDDLERPISKDEIKCAVWDCGTNKSPGSFSQGCNSSFIALIPKTKDAKFVKDFRSVSLIGCIYKIVTKVLANGLCFIIPDLISNVQSTFVTNRQILDDYLDEVLLNFGFDSKWRGWIIGCLSSSLGSVIVNGCLTTEFKFYKGIKLNESLTLSHFFYADDAVFVGKWEASNISAIVNVLNIFHMASGLKINIQKSKLMGVGVSKEKVASAARYVGCSTFSTPFTYLGITVGNNMAKISSWDDHINKLSARLSKWKLKLLSIGGRFTLIIRRNFLNGVDKNDRKIHWIAWKKVLAAKKGGLGVSSYFAYNRALLFKWYWSINLLQFAKQKIGIGEDILFWKDSWHSDLPLMNLFPRVLALEIVKDATVAGKFSDSSFSTTFRRCPRGGVEQYQFDSMCSNLDEVILSHSRDKWAWSLDPAEEFSVKSARDFIDDLMLPKECTATRWIKCIPLKINIFAWRVYLDKLPTRVNISLRGIDIPNIMCPICNSSLESTNHLFFSCKLAKDLLKKVTRWWELEYVDIHSYGDWLEWLKSLKLQNCVKDFLKQFVTFYGGPFGSIAIKLFSVLLGMSCDGAYDKNRDVIVAFRDVDPSFLLKPQLYGRRYLISANHFSNRNSLKDEDEAFDKPHLWYSTSEVIYVLELFIEGGNELSKSSTYRLVVEQPGTVSVLDAFYIEDTPSPVKNKPYAFNDTYFV